MIVKSKDGGEKGAWPRPSSATPASEKQKSPPMDSGIARRAAPHTDRVAAAVPNAECGLGTAEEPTAVFDTTNPTSNNPIAMAPPWRRASQNRPRERAFRSRGRFSVSESGTSVRSTAMEAPRLGSQAEG